MGQYELPPLPKASDNMAGPTPWCNWVIRGQVLAGAYPASTDDRETDKILTILLERGMEVFVCLQAEVSLTIPEVMWRSGKGLRPYIKDAQRLMTQARELGNPRIQISKLNFLHLPIIDGSITTDSAISKLADDCCSRVLAGEKLYIHCWGGHGRTGTLVALMLSRLYKLSCNDALRYTQEMHDARKYPQNVRSPQTAIQRTQVRRILAAEMPQGYAGPAPVSMPPKHSKTALLTAAATSPRIVAAAVTRKASVLRRSTTDGPARSGVPSSRTQYTSSSPLRHSLLTASTAGAYAQPLQLRPSGRVASTAALSATNTPVKAARSTAGMASNSPLKGPSNAAGMASNSSLNCLSNAAMMVASPTLQAYLANSAAGGTFGRGGADRIAAVQGGVQQNSAVGRSSFGGSTAPGVQHRAGAGQRTLDRNGSLQSVQHQNSSSGGRLSNSLSSRDVRFAAATSSVHQYSRKVGEQLSEHLSSAWRKTSSNSGIRHLGEKLQSFKL